MTSRRRVDDTLRVCGSSERLAIVELDGNGEVWPILEDGDSEVRSILDASH